MSGLTVMSAEKIVESFEYFIHNGYKIGYDHYISWDKMLKYLSASLGISDYNRSQYL